MADWYKRYPKLYRLDTMHLSLAEHGAYNVLIDWYMEERRPVPDDDRAIAKILGVGVDEWLALAANVRAFFHPKGGFLHHTRCDKELDAQDNGNRRRSEVASHAANIRHGNINRVDAASSASAAPEHALSMPQADKAQNPAQPRTGSEPSKSQAPKRSKSTPSEPKRSQPLASEPQTSSMPAAEVTPARGDRRGDSTSPPTSETPSRARAPSPSAGRLEGFFSQLRDELWSGAKPLAAMTLQVEAQSFLDEGIAEMTVMQSLSRGMRKAHADKRSPPSSMRAFALSIRDAHVTETNRRNAAENARAGSSRQPPDQQDDFENLDRAEISKWKSRFDGFRERGFWQPMWGPRPLEEGCQAPPDMLSAYRRSVGAPDAAIQPPQRPQPPAQPRGQAPAQKNGAGQESTPQAAGERDATSEGELPIEAEALAGGGESSDAEPPGLVDAELSEVERLTAEEIS